MDEKRTSSAQRTGQKRKRPLKQRVAIALLKILEGEDRTAKNQRTQTRPAQKQPAVQRIPTQQRPKSSPQKTPAQQQKRQPTQQQRQPAQGGSASPRPRMSPQRREQIRRFRRRRRIFRIVIALLFLGVLFLILSRTVLFKIQNIEITNPEAASYTEEQIVAQCGIPYGTQNLFSCNLEKVARNIEQRLPYIGKATVERDFPSSLRITVEPTETAAAIAYGTGYLLIDADGKMLESTDAAPDKVPVLRCNTEFEMNLGQYIGTSAVSKKPDEKTRAAAETISLFKRVYKGVEEAGIQDITLIDIRDNRAITLMYQNRLTLHFGTEDALETKLQTAAKTIAAENDGSKTRTGAIDLTTVPYAFARDTYEPVSATGEAESAAETTSEAA